MQTELAMTMKLSDGEREILAELERDAREFEETQDWPAEMYDAPPDAPYTNEEIEAFYTMADPDNMLPY